jgi:hypothetical protein
MPVGIRVALIGPILKITLFAAKTTNSNRMQSLAACGFGRDWRRNMFEAILWMLIALICPQWAIEEMEADNG